MTNTKSRTIDVTPTWAGIMPILLAAVENGTDKGRDAATAELRRLATVTDKLIAFTAKIARFTTPEDEANGSVDDFLADMSDERLCSEYGVFMEIVREARSINGGA